MDKDEHGRRLKAAMATNQYGREVVADYVDVKVRTVTNWTSGSTMPSPAERAKLRELLGEYDAAGDQVEVAIRASRLAPHRQTRVLACYQEELHQQAREGAS